MGKQLERKLENLSIELGKILEDVLKGKETK